MATANTYNQVADLDFDNIKTSLATFLKSKDTFKDYNFAGSGISTLLDILTYNTQYNAYYLNMVANEMFLDSALQRNSVVSHAKLLGYTPRSAIAPSAVVNLSISGLTGSAYTLPKFSSFLSDRVNGINYNFVTTDSYTSNIVGGVATFNNLNIKQGIPSTYTFTYDESSNPDALFDLPQETIDTTTLSVRVYPNPTSSVFDVYTLATDALTLNSSSKVYFLQESFNGNYQIYFGDGILGKKLVDGSAIIVTFVQTSGTAAAGANNFTLTTATGGTPLVSPIFSASNGGQAETIESIKYQAPKSYSAQNRAVSKNDYITLIQQNNLGYSFDAVNVWGGQENDPPVYGQVFVSIKPAGAYFFTDTQKQRIIQDVIKPISVLTVEPTLIDPDYTYLKITTNVLYDPRKTTLSQEQLRETIKNTIANTATNLLNTFNSTFLETDITSAILSVDSSIITNELIVQTQKKFFPSLTIPTNYNLNFGTKLAKGMFQSGITSTPAMTFRDPDNLTSTITNVFIEEIPSSTGGVDSISIINPGIKYQSAPIVTITGDGAGATAVAVINSNGTIREINMTNNGSGYTSAVVSITAAEGDTTGTLGVAIANIQGRLGALRTYYYNASGVKIILTDPIGTVDYETGLVQLNSFNPVTVSNELAELTITANPATTIISSSFNRIITVDPFDPNAVVVNLTAKLQ
jgi:hypothetical protein